MEVEVEAEVCYKAFAHHDSFCHVIYYLLFASTLCSFTLHPIESRYDFNEIG